MLVSFQRPGMVTLTWTSMNIDAYKHHVHVGLRQLATVIAKVRLPYLLLSHRLLACVVHF